MTDLKLTFLLISVLLLAMVWLIGAASVSIAGALAFICAYLTDTATIIKMAKKIREDPESTKRQNAEGEEKFSRVLEGIILLAGHVSFGYGVYLAMWWAVEDLNL
jgi:amino acid permease